MNNQKKIITNNQFQKIQINKLKLIFFLFLLNFISYKKQIIQLNPKIINQ